MRTMIFIKKTGDPINDPKYNQEVLIYKSPICDPDFWMVKGFEYHSNGKTQIYHINNFREPYTSTSASQRLAELFEERDGCPEYSPGERRYLPEESEIMTPNLDKRKE